MKRLLFTVGTLYFDDVIHALLGVVPKNFPATLTGFSLYQAGFSQLPPEIQKRFVDVVDQQTFSYVFAKPYLVSDQLLTGRAYELSIDQELIIDHWEQYPDWYRKHPVVITADDDSPHDAYIYTLDIAGVQQETLNRMVNDLALVVFEARATRERVLEKFPHLARYFEGV